MRETKTGFGAKGGAQYQQEGGLEPDDEDSDDEDIDDDGEAGEDGEEDEDDASDHNFWESSFKSDWSISSDPEKDKTNIENW